MSILSRFKKAPKEEPVLVQTAREPLSHRFDYHNSVELNEKLLYDRLRFSVPIVDAAICKVVRLTGGFSVRCSDGRYQALLDEFVENVPVGATGRSLGTFVDCYLDSLITYGNAVGEILVSRDSGKVVGLSNGNVADLEVRPSTSPIDKVFYVKGEEQPIAMPQLVLFSSINCVGGELMGRSVLRGLPAISSILLRVYECIGQNFDRVGNVRYAVTYKPSSDSSDRVFSKERAMQIAKEWSDGMQSAHHGEVKDFVAVGDVSIQTIGADNQVLDTEVPVRQLLEQLLSKLSIPPFLLGLSWSSTERMSSQQADMLTSELEYYRRVVTPTIKQVCTAYLRSLGSSGSVSVEWININLQDEVELADARLKNAQALQIETELGTVETV
jgi:hypothetical protein